VVMQMMIRTALTAVLTASRTAINIEIANDAKMKHYENHIAFSHTSRN
jgi:hypothetical protein